MRWRRSSPASTVHDGLCVCVLGEGYMASLRLDYVYFKESTNPYYKRSLKWVYNIYDTDILYFYAQ